MVNLRAEAPSWFPPEYLKAQEEARQFLPGHLQAWEACPIPALEPLPLSPQCYPNPAALDSPLWVPLTCVLELGIITQAEPMRRGPVPPARPPTAQEVCYRRAQQAQRESVSFLQAVQQPSSVHISAPGEKKRISHVPNPLLAAGKPQGPGLRSVSHPVGAQGQSPFYASGRSLEQGPSGSQCAYL